MEKKNYDITGMTCTACSGAVERAVSKLDGVKSASVSLMTNSMIVEYDEDILSPSDIVKTVDETGYEAFEKGVDENKDKTNAVDHVEIEIKEMKQRLIISLIFMVPLMYISMGPMMNLPMPAFLLGYENSLSYAFTQLLLVLPIMYTNRKYFEVGFKTLFNKNPNMDSLIAIGSSAAVLYGIFAIYQIGYGLATQNVALVEQYYHDLYIESAGTILGLITVGKYLEAKAKGKTSDAIQKLVDLAPKMATVIKDGQEIEIPVDELMVDDIFLVKPGYSVPVDGVVLEGSSYIDESALTGESVPVEKHPGSKVVGATINSNGFLKVKATQVGGDTTIAQIIELVENANTTKAPIAKMADKISAIFVPVVIGISILTFIIWMLLTKEFTIALKYAITVLVISCPCALGLATPVAIMVGTGIGAEKGILIKSAESLEMLHSIDTIVLDKTGTITEGNLEVMDIVAFNNYPQEDILLIASSIEKASEHPLGEAIVDYANKTNVKFKEVKTFEAVVGQGVVGSVDGKEYLIGNQRLLESHHIDLSNAKEISDQFASEGKTPIFVANKEEIMGIITMADVIKSDSKEAIAALQQLGLEVVMLTGDNKVTAAAIQRQVGIGHVIAEVMPDEKENVIINYQNQNKNVAMVGDGVNDAVALVRADVGMAIGAGSDIAIESADIILMKDSLDDIVTAIKLSKDTIRNIKQNLFWAFIYNIIGIPIAAGVFTFAGIQLNPTFAAAAMSFSSVSVVLNALRLRFMYRNKTEVKHEKSREQLENQTVNKKTIEIEKKERKTMKKEMMIEGMTCKMCKKHVEEALNELEGVSAEVVLEDNKANIELAHDIEDQVLIDAVTDAGYTVKSVK